MDKSFFQQIRSILHKYDWIVWLWVGLTAVFLVYKFSGAGSDLFADDQFNNPLKHSDILAEASYRNLTTDQFVKSAQDELLVQLNPGQSSDMLAAMSQQYNFQILGNISRHHPVFRIRLLPSITTDASGNIQVGTVDLMMIWQQLQADSRVKTVELNALIDIATEYPIPPDDPEMDEKFEFPKIQAFEAWQITAGSPDVWVAVIDTGADLDHPDLSNNIVSGADFISGGDGLGGETPGDGLDNNQNGHTDENVGHGTHCSGVIAEMAYNNAGAAGVAFDSKILPLRIFPPDGDSGASLSALIEAIEYATDQPKVRVINMSVATTYNSMLLQAVINEAWANGKIMVAAAANENTDEKYYPAAHNHVVAVAALTATGEKANFSNYGEWIDVSAYGKNIFSTYFDDTYAYMSGTSIASPLVAGVAALFIAHNLNATPGQTLDAILGNVDDVYTQNPNYTGKLGSGIINPYKSLTIWPPNSPWATDNICSRPFQAEYNDEFNEHWQNLPAKVMRIFPVAVDTENDPGSEAIFWQSYLVDFPNHKLKDLYILLEANIYQGINYGPNTLFGIYYDQSYNQSQLLISQWPQFKLQTNPNKPAVNVAVIADDISSPIGILDEYNYWWGKSSGCLQKTIPKSYTPAIFLKILPPINDIIPYESPDSPSNICQPALLFSLDKACSELGNPGGAVTELDKIGILATQSNFGIMTLNPGQTLYQIAETIYGLNAFDYGNLNNQFILSGCCNIDSGTPIPISSLSVG